MMVASERQEREENRSESGAVNQRGARERRARERRERRERSEPRAEAAKERRREGQRGDTTRVVHPVLDDEQVETRTTTASYPRPPDRSINGEIDAFSGQTDRVLTYVARSAAQVFFTLQAATTTNDHVHRSVSTNHIVRDIGIGLLEKCLFSLTSSSFGFLSARISDDCAPCRLHIV